MDFEEVRGGEHHIYCIYITILLLLLHLYDFSSCSLDVHMYESSLYDFFSSCSSSGTVFKVKDYYALILSILIPGKFDAGFLPRLMIVAIIGTIYVDEKLIHY